MNYYNMKCKKTRQDAIVELRKNLIMVHNRYSQIKIHSDGNEAIDLFTYGEVEKDYLKEKMKVFIEIALLVEGIEEACENSTDKEFILETKQIASKLKKYMKEV